MVLIIQQTKAMKSAVLITVFLFFFQSQAQVGINTILPEAQLDIRSSNQATPSSTDGLLIPKMDAFPATNPTVAQQGMMVYLTADVTFSGNPKSKGFYYWDNVSSDWIAVGNNHTSGWSITGNSGINASTHFMGTINNADVIFKRNNMQAGLIGSSNTSFGLNALNPLTTGNTNSAFGTAALYSNTTGVGNSAFGGASLLFNTTGNGNSAFGATALYSNTTGFSNSAFGASALRYNTTGINNDAFGVEALTSNTSGVFNAAFGDLSLHDNTTGGNNTAFGFGTLESNTTGNNNSAFGVQALSSATTVSGLSAFGYSALANNTVGIINSAFGANALLTNTTGDFNSAFGNDALLSNTIGEYNSAFGYRSMYSNTTGSDNVSIGDSTLLFNTTGSNNVAIGSRALYSNPNGNNNVAIGSNSGIANGINYATAIGPDSYVAQNYSLVLGSTPGINLGTTTYVGIGTTTPQTVLDVTGYNVNPGGATDGNLLVRSRDAQNIDVGGSISLGGMIDNGASVVRNFASVEGRKANTLNNSSSGYLMFKTNNSLTLAERMRITSVGDVGIGTTTPGGQFELSLNEGRKPGSTTWTVVSDSRLKTVDGTYTKGLNEIIQLQPIRYHYKNNGGRKFEPEVLDTEFAGFIAQEVQPLFPDAVQVDEDGFLNFNMHSILVASINAIKELNAREEELKNKLKIQEERIEKIMQLLTAIEHKESTNHIN